MAIGTGAAILGGSLLGGVASGYAAKKGAKAQSDAAKRASDTEWRMYEQTREDQMPWMNAGEGGLNALMGLYGFNKTPVVTTGTGKNATTTGGDWVRAADPNAVSRQFMMLDPSYQFRLDQGNRSLNNSFAARGGALSGNALRALADYNQDLASTEFGNIANRYASLAGLGQATATNLGSVGANTAQSVGNNMMHTGAARASGYTGMANSLNGLLNNGLMMYGLNQQGFFKKPGVA